MHMRAPLTINKRGADSFQLAATAPAGVIASVGASARPSSRTRGTPQDMPVLAHMALTPVFGDVSISARYGGTT
eukprot:CAMPEP_0119474934 /NCGR_PEP_ID=MMETSP1344-20130328/6000_1 /TAXON_ID=236787 /ORGANISM="Florenciella parvula, Strain CCMP2471" /LENGTH=73 /DNA_ID=CAMNT_0007508325 /DNA_START=50 /DNA_END=269 /DNA_ORIENTATION=+